jgi:plasmid segregation protein ParM
LKNYPFNPAVRIRKPVAAIDLGFGNVKAYAEGADGHVSTTFFPSCVEELDASSQLAQFAKDLPNKDREVHPIVDGRQYRVVIQSGALPAIARPTPVDDFQQSPHHNALVAAALHTLGYTELDVLVVGTPLHTFTLHAAELRRRFEGTHDHGLGIVTIRQVIVLPQPYGTLLLAQNTGKIPADPTLSTVVFDVGFRSTDALCATGLQVDAKRSYGVPVGMYSLYSRFADVLQKEFGLRVSKLERIEYALRTNTKLVLRGNEVDVAALCLPQVQPMIDEVVKTIKGRLETDEDIRIVLTGGGAKFFASAVQNVFNGTPIVMMDDPLNSNAKGFLLAAKAASDQHARTLMTRRI